MQTNMNPNTSNPFANLPPNSNIQGIGPASVPGSFGIKYKLLNSIDDEVSMQEYAGPFDIRTLIWAGCGDLCTLMHEMTQPKIPPYLLKGKSWTGELVCTNHFRTCRDCGRVLCMAGNADGFYFQDDDKSTVCLCTHHHESAVKKLRRAQFWQGFTDPTPSKFWDGFISGLLGGRHGKEK